MKRFLLVLCAALLAVSACSSGGNGSTYRFRSAQQLDTLIAKADRKPAGSFTGPLLAGGTTSLAAYRGKVVVLNFWASWCTPCKIETPQFDLVYRQLKGDGVDFVGIDTKDIKSKAVSFVKDFDISYPIVYDEQGEVAVRLGDLPARALPFTVLIDKRGDVAAVYAQRLTAKDLQGPLATLRRESAT
jgi:thiol-disulfide isomerase/thioredoxin